MTTDSIAAAKFNVLISVAANVKIGEKEATIAIINDEAFAANMISK